jgi:ERCC4-type nuclease
MLLIKVDFREKELIELLQLKISEINTNIKLKVDNLKLGDIAFFNIDKDNNELGTGTGVELKNNENGVELMLFERKSLTDLASSIKDGRYAEQSFRLDGYEAIPNHNIVYLIEGDLSKFKESKYNRVTKKTLLSSMFSILYYKGFSVVRTMNALETCDLISSWADKLEREREKTSDTKKQYYCAANKVITEENDTRDKEEDKEEDKEQSQQYDYCKTLKIKKEKNGNVTPDNIGVIMLCTIPGISSKTAIAIMNEFKTIGQLIKSFDLNPHCLNNICIETNGKQRKIASNCIENIRKYLMAFSSPSLSSSSS